MDKTLHKKLTGKQNCEQAPVTLCRESRISTSFQPEMNMLREAASDLLQPRPQAVASLLKIAREL